MKLIEGHRPIVAPVNMPVWDVDPYDLSILNDPAPYYAELLSKGEVVYLPKYSLLAVGRYHTTHKVFSDYENFVSSRGVGLDDFKLAKPWRPPSLLLEADPPEHTRTRKVMARALSPKVVKTLTDLFQDQAIAIIGALVQKGSFEAVSELAEVFPTNVFPKAVGMTDVNARYLVDYGAMVFSAVGPDNVLRGAQQWHRQARLFLGLRRACTREKLNDDGLGAWIYAAADRGEITHEEAGMLVRSFLSADVDTTVTGIGNALWCLARNPAQWEQLKADPKLVRPAFEEVLRYTSPVHSFARTAGRDTAIAGFPIAEGGKILCVLGAANRDPDKWGNPDSFRIDRRPQGHMAFGAGIHDYVGQNIARAELDAVLSAMIAQVDRIELAGEPVWRPNNAIHALDHLPLTFIAKNLERMIMVQVTYIGADGYRC